MHKKLFANIIAGIDNSTIGKSLGNEYKATLDNIGSVKMSSDVVQDILYQVFSLLVNIYLKRVSNICVFLPSLLSL